MARETPIDLVCGVYRIGCKSNGRYYIGSAANVYRRIGDHIAALQAGKHSNRALQSDWDAYGKDQFLFRLIKKLASSKERFAHEKKLIKSLDRDKLYNITWNRKPASPRPRLAIVKKAKSAVSINYRSTTNMVDPISIGEAAKMKGLYTQKMQYYLNNGLTPPVYKLSRYSYFERSDNRGMEYTIIEERQTQMTQEPNTRLTRSIADWREHFRRKANRKLKDRP